MPRRNRDEYLRAYREAHREKAKAATRAWREADAERERATKRASYLRHRDGRLASARSYAAAHSAEIAAYRIEWLRDNPDKAAVYDAKRLISAATGIRIAAVPQPLAEAKAAWLLVRRAMRSAS